MAGNYPDVPSWRMAWDRDGTQGFFVYDNGTIGNEMSSGNKVAANNEANDTGMYTDDVAGYFVLIFPELRDIDGWLAGWQGSSTQGGDLTTGQVSVDTTNGLDGTWTSLGTAGPNVQSTAGMRSSITSQTALGVKALRFRVPGEQYPGLNLYTMHLYGEPAPGQNLKRLEFWMPTTDTRLDPAYLDWGDIARGSTADKTFRIKNMHDTLTARSIRVAQEALTNTTPSVPAQFLISQGGSFLAQQTIGDLAPGATSGILTLRRVTPSNASLSLWWHRLFAEPDSWS